MKKTYRKLGIAVKLLVICALLSVPFAALATGSAVARAQSTTVEIADATVNVSDSSSVDIWVRNYPDVPDVTPYGLGLYDIKIKFDPTAIQVTGVSPGDAPWGEPVAYSIHADYVSIADFHAQVPGPDGDMRLCDLEFTCLAEGETTLALTVNELVNVNGDPVENTPVDGTITQLAIPQPTTVEIADATVNVSDSSSVDIWVRNYPDVPTETDYGLGAYDIKIKFDPTDIQVTGVSPGDAPWGEPVAYSIHADYVSIADFHAQVPGPDGDMRLCDLEFTCLAEGETTLALTINELVNVNGEPVTATPVNGTISQVLLANTPPGTDVSVEATDPETGEPSPVTATFQNVTAAGNTTCALVEGDTPPNFQLLPIGTCYDIGTTAEFTGSITIAIQYDNNGLNSEQEALLRLVHFVGGEWEDITDWVDTENNIIYGTTTSLSLFGVLLPFPQATVDFDPDTLNLNSKGKVVTVYIELPEDYDVEEIDISTIMLNGIVPAMAKPTEIGDRDGDGVSDLMVKFNRSDVQELLETGDEVEVMVTGELEDDGTPFLGSDTIRVIGKNSG